jgi:hypothetical protein
MGSGATHTDRTPPPPGSPAPNRGTSSSCHVSADPDPRRAGADVRTPRPTKSIVRKLYLSHTHFLQRHSFWKE